jgi:GT2 family glycosyltransferase
MRVVAITPELNVVYRDGDSTESTGSLFAGYGGRKVALCRRILARIARYRWLPRFLARAPLSLCSAEIAEALLARDPDALDVDGLRWGAELRETLRSRYSWPWVSPGSVKTTAFAGSAETVDPLVSIVLPTYNGVRYLRESIESCLNQSHRNLELLIVDDGSTADVRSVVSRFRDPRLRYLRHEKNQGIAAGLNTGFRNSRGQYLTWTSDDNWYAPEAIEVLLRFLQRYTSVDFVYSQSRVVDEHGDVTGLLELGLPASLRANNYVGPCFLYRRGVYERVGDYRTVFLAEDYDYWVRVAASCSMQRLLRPLYYYRMHPGSLTARHSADKVQEQASQVKRLNQIG